MPRARASPGGGGGGESCVPRACLPSHRMGGSCAPRALPSAHLELGVELVEPGEEVRVCRRRRGERGDVALLCESESVIKARCPWRKPGDREWFGHGPKDEKTRSAGHHGSRRTQQIESEAVLLDKHTTSRNGQETAG